MNRKIFTAWHLLLLLALLGGCANDRAFRDGKQLLQEGKVEEGMARLEQASRENPEVLEYRSYLFKQRDLYAGQILAQADTQLINGHFDEAETAYRRVLVLDAANQRARIGVDAVLAARRHKTLLDEAEALFNKGQLEAAQDKLRPVLTDNPRHRDARLLQRRIDEGKLQTQSATVRLQSSIRQPVTLEFRDASLQSIFEIFSRSAGVNFIFDKDVRADLRASLYVKNTRIEDAIQLLLVSNQLDKKVLNANTILIYPNTPAKQRDYQELMVRSFYLANADAKQTLNLIKTMVKTRDVFIDDKLNLLIMRDTPEVIRMAEKLIAAHDLAEPEVMLEVEILEISRSRLTELGMRYPSQLSLGVMGAGGKAGQLSLPEFQSRDSSLVQMTVTDPLLILNLKQQDGNTNLLANPRIRVKNRDKAKVHIGDKVPVITSTSTATGFVAESVSYLDVGLKLDVEPDIHLDDEVAMKVGLEVSNIVREVKSANGTLTYQVGTRNAATALRLRYGETQVLAGLISDEERNSADKVPGMGDLPVLGRLFSSHKDDHIKTEIVLLITPRIVRNLSRPDAMTSEFMSGTEAAIGLPQLALPEQAAAEPAALTPSNPAPSNPAPAPSNPAPAPAPEQPAPLAPAAEPQPDALPR